MAPPSRLSTTPHGDFEGLDIIMWRMRIIPPNSWFRSSWDWVLIMFVLYNLVSIPIEICFPYITPTPLASIVVTLPCFVCSVWVCTKRE